jgi:uncharacterized membrane protein YbhN (UPF0104 family)
MLVLGSITLVLLSLVAAPPSGLESNITDIIAAFPDGLAWLWDLLVDLLWALAVVLAVAALWRRRWAVLRDGAVALVLATGLGFLIGWAVSGEWAPWAGLIVPVTVVKVANPHLTRPFRVLGWWAVGLGMLGALMLPAAPPSAAAAAVVIGIVAAAAVALIFGSPKGRPDIDSVRTALSELGVGVSRLSPAERETEGVFVLDAVSEDGTPLQVKVYGRDAYDTQLLSTAWRTVWFRRPGAPTAPGRLQQVEHEALITLLAAQGGVATTRVVIAGEVGNGDALLVMEAAGRPLGPGDWDRRRVAQVFGMVARLRQAGIAHGQVDADHIVVIGDDVGLVEFRGGRVTTDPWWTRVDEVQALVTAVLALGVDPALDEAAEALGSEELALVLAFLQTDVLTSIQRRGLDEAGIDIDGLRLEVADRAGVEPPELVQLRRITVGSIISVVLPILAFFALASLFAGLDIEVLVETLADASWWFVVVGMIVSQLPRFTQALSAMGASPIPVPLGRLFLLQNAQAYLALTVPSSAARIALNLRFFQRHGLSTGTALAVGAIDSFTGFICQMILLLLILVVGSVSVDVDMDTVTSSGLAQLVIWIVALALLMVVVVLVVPRFRRPIIARLRSLVKDGMGAIRGLASPRRLALLFGGGLATEILFGLSIGAFALALGYPVALPILILINVLVSLLSGVLPIPGGIGVVEGGIMLGLARAGVPEEAAFAIAILYRLGTYYLPPIWGFFAFRSLQKDGHL